MKEVLEMPKRAMLGSSESGPITIDVPRLIETRALVMANSGGGKSWALRRMLEQTYGQVQQIVIDVEDEFYTLREKFDYVLAGRQGGDCPATVHSAALLARRLIELQVSAVVGIYELKSHERIRFVQLFLEELINLPKSLWHPVLIVIDEAHMFCPENGKAESSQAVIDLQSRGRKRGFCGVLATQRPAMLNKNASAQCINKLIGRFSQDIDVKRAADDLGFYKREDQARLRTLTAGSFFAVGPALCEEVSELRVGPVETTHPRAGQRTMAAPPPRDKVKAVLSQLADLPREAEEKARTVEALQAELRAAKATIRTLEAAKPTAVDPEALEKARIHGARAAHDAYADVLRPIAHALGITVETFQKDLARLDADVKRLNALDGFMETQTEARPARIQLSDKIGQLTKALKPRPLTSRVSGPGEKIPDGERAILIAAAQFGSVKRKQLTVLAGYKRSTRDAYIVRLKAKDFITVDADSISPTDAGMKALGSDYEPLPTGVELQEYWLDKLPEGEARILQILLDAGGRPVEREQIDAKLAQRGEAYARSSRDAYIQRMKAKQVVEVSGRGEVRASEDLFE